MPDRDVQALLQGLRRGAQGDVVPVIGVAATVSPADARRAESAGFAACLRKPIQIDQLIDTLARAAGTAAAGSLEEPTGTV